MEQFSTEDKNQASVDTKKGTSFSLVYTNVKLQILANHCIKPQVCSHSSEV